KPIKSIGRGKGFLRKKGAKIAIERVSIPKMRRTKTVTKETSQSKKVAYEVDFEATDKEDEIPLKARKASKDDFILQQRLRGSCEGSGVTLEDPDELTHKSSNEGSGVTSAVPGEPRDSDNSSSSASEDEIEDISSNEADDTKKADIEKGSKE
nr:hypothetical protein [Tanacetum cinerariifolium]